MSDTKVTLDIFPDGKSVSVIITGETYSRLTQLLLESVAKQDLKDLDTIFKNLMANEPKNRFEYHMATMLYLINDIETALKEQGVVETKEVDLGEISSQEKPE